MTHPAARVRAPYVLYVSALLMAVAALTLLGGREGADAAPPGQARYVATTGDDDGGANDCLAAGSPCLTVAHALAEANAGDIIEVGAGTFTTRLSIDKDVTIRGAACAGGAPTTVLDGDGNRVLQIAAGLAVRLECVEVTGGSLVDASGAGISNAGTLTIVDSVVRDNDITPDSGPVFIGGGGIHNDSGTLTVVGSTVSGNSGKPGATLVDEHVLGAGIYNYEGTVTVVDSRIVGNAIDNPDGQANGAGIFNSGNGMLWVVRSEVSGNEADGDLGSNGGGLYYSGTVGVRNVTFTGNQVGGVEQHVRHNAGTDDLEWNYWGDGSAPEVDTDISGTALPLTYCTTTDCLGLLDIEVDGAGSVSYAHGGDAAFTAALVALADARGHDFEDFVLSYGANTAPACTDDCTWALPLGIDLALTPTADPGHTFVGWSGAGCGDDMTIDGDLTCTATFEVIAAPPADEPPPPEVIATTGGLDVPVVNRRWVPLAAGAQATVETWAPDGSSVKVTFPDGAFGEAIPAGLRLEVAAAADMEAVTDQAPVPPEAAFVAQFVVHLTNASGSPISAEFEEPVTLEFTIPAGLLPLDNVPGDTLVLVYWDGEAWVQVPAIVTVNADGSVTLTAEVTHFTMFGVLDAPHWGTFLPVPAASGATLVRWAGGGYDLLDASLTGGRGVWVWRGGQPLGYVLGAPAFVNAGFLAQFPEDVPAGTPLLVVRP